jgi:RNA recognition motif-containing protein
MGTKLFVGNLSYSITEQQLREAFSQQGRTVQSVRIAFDRETQRPRGFAFVEVATDADAESAIKELNGNPLAGRNVFVEKAQERAPGAPRPPRPPRPMGAGGPGGPGGGPGGPGGPRSFGGPPRMGGYRPMASAEPQREEQRRRQARPERKNDQKRKTSGRPEERERGKWRWDGSDDY